MTPKLIKGVHKLILYNEDDIPVAEIKTGNLEITGKGDVESLKDGNGTWATVSGPPSYEISFNGNQFESDLLPSLFLTDGETITAGPAITEESGDLQCATGILECTATGTPEPGYYTLVGNSTGKVDLYGALYTGSLIQAENITVTQNVTTAISSTGLSVTGGSGTISITDGQVYSFYVNPAVAGKRFRVGLDMEDRYASIIAYPMKYNGLYNSVKTGKFLLPPNSVKITDKCAQWEIKADLIRDDTIGFFLFDEITAPTT